MISDIQAVESEALALPEKDRVHLTLHLLESFELRPSDNMNQVEQIWLEESERRYQTYLAGQEKAISAEQAFAILRQED